MDDKLQAPSADAAHHPDRPATRRPFLPFLLGLSLLLGGLILAATGMGFMKIPLVKVVEIILGADHLDPVLRTVVFDVRLPRILTAAMVGGGLALAGVVFQGLLLNPLADPYTLGVSSGAAFGAALALLCNLTFWGAYSVTACAFIGALLTLFLVLRLAGSAGKGLSSNNLILAGIIIAAILSAAISMIKFLADEQVAVIIFWLMGSFTSKTWSDLLLVTVFALPGMALILFFARELNLLSLGTRAAASLGVDTRKVTLLLLVAATLVAAACVAVSGIIGFVGLLVPHLVRGLIGPDNRRLVPLAFLCGALLLLSADTVTRALLPREVPIGVLTALIGGPFFCWIYQRRLQR
ncbi:MAG: iron ABC transporter permease [Deltaproteobacteria bacterium]|nr:iron ABC transporter permease [Deltaproteobacteria bacterium]